MIARVTPNTAFTGRPFLYGLGALGAEGPEHVCNLLAEELRTAMGQIGITAIDQARSITLRHNTAFAFAEAVARATAGGANARGGVSADNSAR